MKKSIGWKFALVFIFHHTNGMSLPTASPEEAYGQIDIDPNFSVDIQNLEVSEMARTIQVISGAVMGTAEIAMGIKSDLKLLRKEIMMGKMNMRFEGRHHPESSSFITEQRVRHNLELAERLKKIFNAENSTLVDIAKEEIQSTIRINFIRILAAMLVNGPPSTQRRKEDILRLMKSVLNGELDFKPVVDKLPFILKESETNQFIHLIQTIKEDEFPKIKIVKGRQDDEDEDGDDDSQTAAPVAVPAEVTPGVQETVIFVARPQPPQNTGVAATQAQNNLKIPGGPMIQPTVSNNSASSMNTATPAPLRIVVRQPQPPPPKPVAATPPPKSQLNNVLDAVKQLDVNQFQSLIGNLPDLFEGIDAIVDGVEGFIGDQPAI